VIASKNHRRDTRSSGEGVQATEGPVVTWLQRHRLRRLLSASLWITPAACMAGALALAPLIRRLDEATRWSLFGFGAAGARALMAAFVTTTFTCIVFVFTILLVAVQIASAQLTPRIIARAFANGATRTSVGLFAFTFVYGLAVLSRIDASVPQLAVALTIVLNMVTIATFVYLVSYLGEHLRPVSVLTDVGSHGIRIIEQVYPSRLTENAAPATAAADVLAAPSQTVELSSKSGVVLALDVNGLTALAEREDCIIEVVPQVGDFVAKGDPLFNVYGGTRRLDESVLESIALGSERTMEQDPAFAFRIVVDIALKALSPAVNDPTTAVLAIDQIHHLLRKVGLRQLDTGVVRDRAGRVRLVYRTPDWEDFVELAITEIRQYGADSVQVARRLLAMLENLLAFLPPTRKGALQTELTLLEESVALHFRNAEDRSRASQPDSQGVGGVSGSRTKVP
jgi:uncharacterized membrane protein